MLSVSKPVLHAQMLVLAVFELIPGGARWLVISQVFVSKHVRLVPKNVKNMMKLFAKNVLKSADNAQKVANSAANRVACRMAGVFLLIRITKKLVCLFLFAALFTGCAQYKIPVLTQCHPACTDITTPQVQLSPILEIPSQGRL